MHFKRTKGEYRETDRVTRFKLIKSGKHWLRAATSYFGLFRVLKGGVDKASVRVPQLEENAPSSVKEHLLKGLLTTGALLTGAATTYRVQADESNDASALERAVSPATDVLAASDSAVLGHSTKPSQTQSQTEAASASISESASVEASVSHSLSVSTSASESASTSASESASTSASESASTSASQSASTSASASMSSSPSMSSEPIDSQVVSGEELNSRVDSEVQVANSPIASSLVVINSQTMNITSTATATIAITSTSEVTSKKIEEDRKKLEKLSAEMGEYLAKAVDLPDTDSAILKVKTATAEIESALKEPNVDLGPVIKSATSARNSIVNAVLRANSGKRDSRNGQIIPKGENLRGFAPITQNEHTTASLEQGTFVSGSREVSWRINMHSQSPLNYAGLIAQVDKNTTITRVLFNGQPMEKNGGSGNEYVFNKRHDLNRNLEATIWIYATVNNNSSEATLNAQVATSSRPFDGSTTSGNYTQVMNGSVPTGTGQRATDKAPTISITPSYVEVYNDEVLGGANGIPFVMKDDKGVLTMLADPNNTIITGLTMTRTPIGNQGFKPYYSNRQNPKEHTSVVGGTIGRDNGWKPMTPGVYNLDFKVFDTARQSTLGRLTLNIKGFNERNNPVSGDTVTVNNPSSLSETEKAQILANFKNQNATILSSADYVKASEGGKEITVSNTGEITITYRDNTVDIVQASVRAETEVPVPAVTVTRDGQTIPATPSPVASRGNEHIVYAGDDFTIKFTATDNSGKLKEFKIVPKADGSQPGLRDNFFEDPKYGTGSVGLLTGDITATPANPATITVNAHMKDDLEWKSGNTWQRNAVATDQVGNVNGTVGTGNVRITQGQLKDRLSVTNPDFTPVADKNNLTETEKTAVKNAIYAKNNQTTHRIKDIEVQANGTATIVYNDGTRSTPIPQSVTVNERPKLVISYDRPATKEIDIYRDEEVNLTFKATDDSGKISSLKFERQDSADDSNGINYAGYDGLKRSNPITNLTDQANATITITGKLDKKFAAGQSFVRYLMATDDRNTADSNHAKNGITDNGYVKFNIKNQTDKYNAVSKSSTVYTFIGETADDLSNATNFVQLEGGKQLPQGATVTWKTPIDTTSYGNNKKAVATVRYSDGSTDDVTINYSTMATIAPKEPINDIQGTTPHNGTAWYDYVYQVGGAFPSGASQKWTTAGGSPQESSPINTAEAGSFTYNFTFTYPVGRFGESDAAKVLSKTVNVVHNVYKFESNRSYVFTQSQTNDANYQRIVANPKDSITKVTGAPDYNVNKTNFRWANGEPDLSTVGRFTKDVEVELPADGTGVRVKQRVPITYTVNPQAPQIADDQVTNTGGLPNRSITVTNVTPGSTVTLTIAGHIFTKEVNNTDTSITFDPTDLKQAYDENNGLLPIGEVTAKQEKVVTLPSGGTETLTSATTTKTITKETERPEATFELYVKNDKTGLWEKQTIKNNVRPGVSGYEVFAGDKIKVVLTAKDNSGKIKTLKLYDGVSDKDRIFQEGYSSDDAAPGIKDTPTEASATNPKVLEYTATYGENVQYNDKNKWTRGTNATDLSDNTGRVTAVVAQGKLNEKFPGIKPSDAVQVSNLTSLTQADLDKILAAVKASNPASDFRIKSYDIDSNGTVTITYKDGTQNTVTPDLSDSDYKSASQSASTSASESASTSASQSASTSARASASTSASQSASTSASESASTSASMSASTSASESASTSASMSASTSASESASTSASQSASTSASESASTSASQSASTSASESASTSASQSASTSASESASTSASMSASTSASESASTSASQSASTSATDSASTSASQSASTSASESASTSASMSASTSASESASTSASQSASTSASESASTSASQSASTSASESASTSASQSASTSASESASTSASQSASTSASESASTSASQSASTSASESASTSASQSASTSASESASTSASQSASTSASESASTSASQSASTSASESASTSASQSASTSASESASTSASQSASTSASESASTSASMSASTSASESASTSASQSASTSASESASTSASQSASTSASESASTSASQSASTSASESASTSASQSASTSASESASTSASMSASTSASESASTSASQSASTSASESASTSASQSASTRASESASTSASQSASTSASESASTSASQSASTSTSESASTSASQSASTSASESASTSASQSASTSASESASTSASQSASTSASESASTSASQSASTRASESASTSASQRASTSATESARTSASQRASPRASGSARTAASPCAGPSASESASTSASQSASTSASESASTSA